MGLVEIGCTLKSWTGKAFASPPPKRVLLIWASSLLAGPSQASQDIDLVGADWLGNAPSTNYQIFPALNPSVEGFTTDVVYARSQVPTLRMTFRNNEPFAFSGAITFDYLVLLNTLASPGLYHPLSVPGPVPINISAGPGTVSTVNVSFGSMPDFVAHGRFTYSARVLGSFGGGQVVPAWGSSGDINKVYVAYGTPTDETVDPVWTDMLSLGCEWAFWCDNEADVKQALTYGLFWHQSPSPIFAYNLGTPGVPSNYFLGKNYKLKKLFLDYSQSGGVGVPGNCFDVAGFNCLQFRSQGIDGEPLKMAAPNQQEFVTNRFCPIGSNANLDSLHFRVPFSNHVVTSASGNVFDAATAHRYYYLSGDWKEPEWAWPVAPYWQTLLGGNAYGLTYGLVRPGDVILPPGQWPANPDYPTIQPVNPSQQVSLISSSVPIEKVL